MQAKNKCAFISLGLKCALLITNSTEKPYSSTKTIDLWTWICACLNYTVPLIECEISNERTNKVNEIQLRFAGQLLLSQQIWHCVRQIATLTILELETICPSSAWLLAITITSTRASTPFNQSNRTQTKPDFQFHFSSMCVHCTVFPNT